MRILTVLKMLIVSSIILGKDSACVGLGFKEMARDAVLYLQMVCHKAKCTTITVFPVLVSLRGYANPDMAMLDDWPSTQLMTFRDLGPEVTHYYEVSNYGPFDVRSIVSEILTHIGNLYLPI